jgi:hypothetical protein
MRCSEKRCPTLSQHGGPGAADSNWIGIVSYSTFIGFIVASIPKRTNDAKGHLDASAAVHRILLDEAHVEN